MYVYFERVDAWLIIWVCLYVHECALHEGFVYVCVTFPAWAFSYIFATTCISDFLCFSFLHVTLRIFSESLHGLPLAIKKISCGDYDTCAFETKMPRRSKPHY